VGWPTYLKEVSGKLPLRILAGRVSVKVTTIADRDTIFYQVKAIGEKEIQQVDSNELERGPFNYSGHQYIINVTDYTDDIMNPQVKLTIAKVKPIDEVKK
jgi:hypothetical protein